VTLPTQPSGVPLPFHRRFRPSSFADVVGQGSVIEALKGALKTGQTSGSFLFHGPHGVGKTTLARVFAAAVNCSSLDRQGVEPCGSCPSCQEVLSGSQDALDFIEQDAGSNTGVDAARDLAVWAQQVPVRDRKRILLVDEIQQRSRAADSTWLKLMEEPPEHLLLLACTTEPQQVLATIRSRSICLQLRPHLEADVTDRLRHIADLEGVRADDAVLAEIAAGSQGHMRDALQTFQRLALLGRAIELEDVWEGTAKVPPRLAGRFVMAVLNGNGMDALQQSTALLQGGIPAEPLLLGLAQTFRDCAVMASIKGGEAMVRLPADMKPKFLKMSALRPPADWRLLLHETEQALRRLRLHTGKESLLVDLYVLELLYKLHEAPKAPQASAAPQTESPPPAPAKGKPAAGGTKVSEPPPLRDREPAPPATAPQKDGDREALIGAVRNVGTQQALRRAQTLRIEGDVVRVVPANNRHRGVLAGVQEQLSELFSELLERPVRLEVS